MEDDTWSDAFSSSEKQKALRKDAICENSRGRSQKIFGREGGGIRFFKDVDVENQLMKKKKESRYIE